MLGDSVKVSRDKTKITVTSDIAMSKRYLKYLTKKYLKKVRGSRQRLRGRRAEAAAHGCVLTSARRGGGCCSTRGPPGRHAALYVSPHQRVLQHSDRDRLRATASNTRLTSLPLLPPLCRSTTCATGCA